MKNISIDLETYSSVNLAKTGVYRYAEAPDFEILLFGYSADGGKVHVIDVAGGEAIPTDIVGALTDDNVTKWAYNANFERICLSRFLGYPTGEYLDPASWRCSMVWSATMGLPLSLEGAGAVLGLEKQKLTEGKELIRYFCMPCKPTAANGQRTRNLPSHAPDRWKTFKAYNTRDVETEMSIQTKLAKFPVPESVWVEYCLDQEINDRGVALDTILVRKAITMDSRSRTELTAAMQALTELDNPNSVQQMKRWLADNGLETDTLGKKNVAELLKTAPPELARVLSLRQQLAKSSVRKYQTMENAVCSDGRARGMFQFYGANRTGRWSGRLIQMQNLPQNHLPDLEQARALVRSGNFDALEMLYEDVPDTLSQLIRTAFIPKAENKFIVSDFSAIEARVIAWLAGERWRQKVFAEGGDIYCMSASTMFHMPVEKHGVNGHLRQKGKIAELACIAEGQLVLTDHGLVPIEKVSLSDLLWDGSSWVRHGGVVFKGEREVIEYEGLTATPDHLVWAEGQREPIQFGLASASGAHLLQTGDGRRALRMGGNHQFRETLEQEHEPLLCTDEMFGLRPYSMAGTCKPCLRKVPRMSAVFSAKTNPALAQQTPYCGETALREPKMRSIPELRRARHSLSVQNGHGGRLVFDKSVRSSQSRDGDRPDRQRLGLCFWKYPLCDSHREQPQQTSDDINRIRTGILAICKKRGNQEAFAWAQPEGNHPVSGECCVGETEKLAYHRGTARLYDIRNAGEHHRFTVSGHLVHNCGYGGSVGALKAMGALDMGLTEDELPLLVDAWRQSNPNIVKLWWDVGRAAMDAVRHKHTNSTHGITFSCKSGMLFITLPSGRRLAYVKPRIGENKFGGSCITYEGVGATKKWERLDTYGPKIVENCTQAISRDILSHAMQTLKFCSIVMHIHDEVVIEADPRMSLPAVCEQMSRTPLWAPGLLLSADGYECSFYKKD